MTRVRAWVVGVDPRALSRDSTAPVAPDNVIPEQAKVLAHYLLVEGMGDGLVLNGSGPSRVEVRPAALRDRGPTRMRMMTAIKGNTYPVRDELRALGGKWNADD